MAVRGLDPKKKEIIEHVDGPLLVIAGPGAGKTMAIVERVVHLIAKCGVAPESILVSTFTEKAAAEYDVSIPTETYILRGVIDLVRGEGDTVEIVDFKTDRKPNVNSAEDRQRIQNYHRQLEVYAHIVEEKFGKKVSKLHLYYTRAENESPYVSWDYSTVSVQKTLLSFDETVGKIESYKFSNKGVKMCKATCDNCDLRYFCHFK